jgi:hypothetical protein
MLIGLHGRARSGKDTACQFILDWAEENEVDARRDAFADRLKLSAARLFYPDIDVKWALEWADLMKSDGTVTITFTDPVSEPVSVTEELTGRQLLQRYGTEAHRDVFDTDFWVNAVMDTYRPDDELLVVTDIRFPNEAEAIREAGGEVWQVLRTQNVDLEDTHASEQPLSPDLIDHVLVNDRSLDHLRSLAVSRVQRLYYTERTGLL